MGNKAVALDMGEETAAERLAKLAEKYEESAAQAKGEKERRNWKKRARIVRRMERIAMQSQSAKERRKR